MLNILNLWKTEDACSPEFVVVRLYIFKSEIKLFKYAIFSPQR